MLPAEGVPGLRRPSGRAVVCRCHAPTEVLARAPARVIRSGPLGGPVRRRGQRAGRLGLRPVRSSPSDPRPRSSRPPRARWSRPVGRLVVGRPSVGRSVGRSRSRRRSRRRCVVRRVTGHRTVSGRPGVVPRTAPIWPAAVTAPPTTRTPAATTVTIRGASGTGHASQSERRAAPVDGVLKRPIGTRPLSSSALSRLPCPWPCWPCRAPWSGRGRCRGRGSSTDRAASTGRASWPLGDRGSGPDRDPSPGRGVLLRVPRGGCARPSPGWCGPAWWRASRRRRRLLRAVPRRLRGVLLGRASGASSPASCRGLAAALASPARRDAARSTTERHRTGRRSRSPATARGSARATGGPPGARRPRPRRHR